MEKEPPTFLGRLNAINPIATPPIKHVLLAISRFGSIAQTKRVIFFVLGIYPNHANTFRKACPQHV